MCASALTNWLYSGLLARAYDALWRHFTEVSASHVLERVDAARSPRRIGVRPRVLDAGSGTGYLLEQLARRYPDFDLVGLDASVDMLAQAARRVGPKAALVAGIVGPGPTNSPPFLASSFDLVVSSNVLHYVPDASGSLAALAALLRPGGTMAIADFARRPRPFPWRAFERIIRFVDRAHVRAYSLDEAVCLCHDVQLQVRATEEFVIDRVWRGWVIQARYHYER